MISEKEFKDAVYSFDMGQNDISMGFTANLTYQQVLETLPASISHIKDAIVVSNLFFFWTFSFIGKNFELI
jgi:hypothetical protein